MIPYALPPKPLYELVQSVQFTSAVTEPDTLEGKIDVFKLKSSLEAQGVPIGQAPLRGEDANYIEFTKNNIYVNFSYDKELKDRPNNTLFMLGMRLADKNVLLVGDATGKITYCAFNVGTISDKTIYDFQEAFIKYEQTKVQPKEYKFVPATSVDQRNGAVAADQIIVH